MRFSDLKRKEVINACTCKSLGYPVDIEFKHCTGKITALVVPGPGKFCCFFGRDMEYRIPWENICQIGDDIILVKIDEDRCCQNL